MYVLERSAGLKTWGPISSELFNTVAARPFTSTYAPPGKALCRLFFNQFEGSRVCTMVGEVKSVSQNLHP